MSNFLISQFEKWNLTKVIEETNSLMGEGDIIYYKKIDNNRYLIFGIIDRNDAQTKKGTCDCLIGTFENQSDIGKVDPIKLETIVTDFKLSEDFELIEEYIE